MDISRGTVIKSIIWKLLEKISVQGVQFIVTIVLARLLSPSEFGLVTLITVFIVLSNVIIEGGLSTALIQKKDSNNEDFYTILCVNIVVSTILYLILFFGAPLIASFYNEEQLIGIIRVLSITLFFYALNSVQMAYVAKNMLFKKMFVIGLTSSVSAGVIGILLAFVNLGVWALVAYNLSMSFFTTVLLWIVVKWRPRLFFSKKGFKRLFDFGWKIFVTNFIITLFVNIRSLIIGKIYSAGTLAVFDRGKQFPCLIVDNVNSSIQAVMLPTFSNAQDDRVKVKSMLSRSIKTSSLVITPIIVALFVMAKPLVLLLLSDKWIEAVPFVRIFCIAYLFYPMQITNMEVIKSLGYSNLTLRLEIIKKVLEVLILIISLCFDVYAIAWGVVIYNYICIFINLYPNSKLINYGVFEQLKDIFPVVLVSIIMGLGLSLILLIDLPNYMIVLVQLLLGSLIYFGMCYQLKLESFMYVLDMIKQKVLYKKEIV